MNINNNTQKIHEADKRYINKYKMAHNVGVAEYMAENAPKYNLDPNEMYLIGLLHDIGYINGREGHEESGASLIMDTFKVNKNSDSHIFTNNKALFAIRWHGTDPNQLEIENRDINMYIRQDHPELFLLYEADMNVGIDGFRIGFRKRLEDFKKRYGEDSIAYKTARNTVKYVTLNMYAYSDKYGNPVTEGLMFCNDDKETFIVTHIYCDNLYYKKVIFDENGDWGTEGDSVLIKVNDFNSGDFIICS